MSAPLDKQSLTCPSCNGETELVNRFVKLVVCQYCGQSILRTADGATAQGKAAQLADLYTDLSLGASGTVAGRTFSVQGRARFAYDAGFWDEWYVMFDDLTTGWLHEDEGELSLLTEVEPDRPYDLGSARVGHRFGVAGVEAFVKEKRTAKVYGAEGQLPRGLIQGAAITYVDAQLKGRLYFLEQTGSTVSLMLGERLDDDALVVD